MATSKQIQRKVDSQIAKKQKLKSKIEELQMQYKEATLTIRELKVELKDALKAEKPPAKRGRPAKEK